MPSLHLLGTGAAISEAHRTTTMLGLSNSKSLFLIDCGGDVIQRVFAANLDLSLFSGILLTHEHADHVSGFPLFMEKIWLWGWHAPVPVYGPPAALDQAKRCFETFDVSTWQNFPEILWHEGVGTIMDNESWKITTDWVEHTVPAVGARIECKETGAVIGYSGDTVPTESVVRIAHEADILVHEATETGPGHSTAVAAAEIAKRARAHRLLLVHLPATLKDETLSQAQDIFGPTEWGKELGAYTI